MENFYNLGKGIFLLLSLMAFSYAAQAQGNATWTGGGATTNWSDGGNWNTGTAPGAGGNATISSNVTITFITSPTVKLLHILPNRTVILDIGANTLNVGATGTSNVVRLDASTLEIASGTFNFTADIGRDAFQFRGTGGTFNVAEGATVNATGQEGFTSKSDAIDGTINNSGVINIVSVSNEDAIELSGSAPLTLVNEKCGVINLGTGNIKTTGSTTNPTSITNNGLITHTGTGAGIRLRNNDGSTATNNGFYDYASSADFATGNSGNGRTDNGVELNPAVSIDAGTDCVIDLTSEAAGMVAYDWAFGGTTVATNAADGMLDLTGADFPDAAGPNTITVAGCPEYSISIDVTNTCPAAVLPVELVRFTGGERGTVNLLEWTTASELNNDFFEVQRSTNGTDFETLESVKGNGTVHTVSTYSFIDEKPAAISYYRLQQVDFDGASAFSNIVTIKRDLLKDDAQLFPSPVKDVLSVNYQAAANKELTMSVVDMTGRVLISKSVNAVKGNNEFHLDLANLPTGTYMTRLNSGTDNISQLIVKL